MTDRTVQIAAVHIEPSPGVTIAGFVLIFSNGVALNEFLDGIREYFNNRTWSERMQIKLQNTGMTTTFYLEASASTQRTSLCIEDVDPTIVDIARKALSEQKYYFIMTALKPEHGQEFE